MTINRDEIFFIYDGKEYCDEQAILSILLEDEILMAYNAVPVSGFDGKICPKTIALSVNCSDVFMWGCCDSEDITMEELPELYKMHIAGKHGSTKWVCKKRNEQPQRALITLMKDDGTWDDMMESLPKNIIDG